MDTNHDHVDELTLEEIEAEAAEALPERAAMSTLNITSLDTAGAAIEAVGDGAPEAVSPSARPRRASPAPLSERDRRNPHRSMVLRRRSPGARAQRGRRARPTGDRGPPGTPASEAPEPQAGADTSDARRRAGAAGRRPSDAAAAPEPESQAGTSDATARGRQPESGRPAPRTPPPRRSRRPARRTPRAAPAPESQAGARQRERLRRPQPQADHASPRPAHPTAAARDRPAPILRSPSRSTGPRRRLDSVSRRRGRQPMSPMAADHRGRRDHAVGGGADDVAAAPIPPLADTVTRDGRKRRGRHRRRPGRRHGRFRRRGRTGARQHAGQHHQRRHGPGRGVVRRLRRHRRRRVAGRRRHRRHGRRRAAAVTTRVGTVGGVSTTRSARSATASCRRSTTPSARSAAWSTTRSARSATPSCRRSTTRVGTVGGVVNDTLGTVGDTVLPAVDDTVGTVGGVVNDTLGTVGDTVLPAVDDTRRHGRRRRQRHARHRRQHRPARRRRHARDRRRQRPAAVNDTLDTVGNTVLPAVDDTVGTLGSTVTDVLGALQGSSLLDLNADLAANLDVAAPIGAAVGLNANAAVPIDASVSANALSPDATSFANAPQDSLLQQALVGEANAQLQPGLDDQPGRDTRRPAPPPSADTGGDLLAAPASLLNLDVNLDLALDLAAPINAALAANANIAAPIDAAVSANILSPGSTSIALADQNSVIVQTLQGVANATGNQTSTIDQGESHHRREAAHEPRAGPGARGAAGPRLRAARRRAGAPPRTTTTWPPRSRRRDGSHVSDFAWDVSRQRGGRRRPAQLGHRRSHAARTAARRRSRSRSCSSPGAPAPLTPHNRAVAVNDQCTRCVVAAEARQFVRVVDAAGEVHRRRACAELADVRQRPARARGAGPLGRRPARRGRARGGTRARTCCATEVVPKSDPDGDADVLERAVCRTRTSADCAIPSAADPPRTGSGEVLALADGIELVGEYEDSGFKEPPLLARRADGQMIQLTRLLYLVAAACDGRRDARGVAAAVTGRYGDRRVSAAQRALPRRQQAAAARRARAAPTGPRRSCRKRAPVMALRHRRPLVPERAVNVLARALHVAAPAARCGRVLLALAAFDVWLFGIHGIAGGAARRALQPGAAARRARVDRRRHRVPRDRPRERVPLRRRPPRRDGRRPLPGLARVLLRRHRRLPAQPRGPPAHRPRRRLLQRASSRSLAGAGYFATGQEALLLVAFVQHTIVLQQLLPLLRFDGYYVLSDLTGVPDILSRIKPIFRSLVPGRAPSRGSRRSSRGCASSSPPTCSCSSRRSRS